MTNHGLILIWTIFFILMEDLIWERVLPKEGKVKYSWIDFSKYHPHSYQPPEEVITQSGGKDPPEEVLSPSDI